MAVKSVRRCRGDDGVALVEFSIVMVLLFTLIYGIITFAVLLSFRQNLVQSAAEGARAGAVAATDFAEARADAATEQSVNAFDESCVGGSGLTCVSTVHACGGGSTADCITIDITYDLAGNPLLPEPPFIGGFLPDTIEVSSTAEMNPDTTP